MTRDAYIVSARRTAVGKAFSGGLRTKRPDDAMPEAEQGMNVARFILLLAGLPESVPGVTVNRFCCSGVQSIAMAADRIRAGDADCIVAGGTETMTMVPMMGNKVVGSRTVMDRHPDFYLGMGLTAENVAEDYKVSREDQDQFAVSSHQKAIQAITNGHFKDEIIPVKTTFRYPDKNGEVKIEEKEFAVDDGPRGDTNLEALAKLRPAFKTKGTVTAGNTSQMSDGAGLCLVVSEEFLKNHKLKPEARFAGYQVAGVPPRVMGIGPIAAIPKVLKRAGVKLSDIDRFELNEAFAAQSLAVMRHLEIDAAKVNPDGGAIALGHPLGATGGKLTATLLNGLRRTGGKYGMVTMCIGTGMGAAALFERL